jgi:hypothetical protein
MRTQRATLHTRMRRGCAERCVFCGVDLGHVGDAFGVEDCVDVCWGGETRCPCRGDGVGAVKMQFSGTGGDGEGEEGGESGEFHCW